MRVGIHVEPFGDTEIQQLDLAFARYHHVARLEIAVHDQGAMRGFDGAADIDEQLQASRQIEFSTVHVVGDRLAVDQFECDVGHTGIGDAALDQLSDARVTQLGERMAFVTEAALLVRRV